MSGTQQVQTWIGHDVVDQSGDKIGSIEEIYLDDATGTPEWLAIKTGMFGRKLSFAPVQGATAVEDHLRIPLPKDTVKDAPTVDPDGHLEPDEEAALYQHYGRAFTPPVDRSQAVGDRDTTTDGSDGDATMTLSEEELSVGTRSRPSGKARLRKYVVTEQVTRTVPVRREEVRIEREPITETEQQSAGVGRELAEDEQELVLHEEEVVTDTRVVPKERVRLATDVVSDEQEISEEVRKERVEMDRSHTPPQGTRR